MDYAAYKFWFDIFQTVIIAAIGIQQFLYRRQSATVASINRIEDNANAKINLLENRLTRLEETANHCPTHEEIGKIYEEIKKVNSSLANTLTQVSGHIQKLDGAFGEFSRETSNKLNLLYQNELSKGAK